MDHEFLLAFVPMFFAMDPIGLVPIFVGLTSAYSPVEKKRIIVQSLVTATLVAIGFIFFGHWVFKLLGITMGDFMVAGGVILCCLSILDLCGRTKDPSVNMEGVGAVPIGTPLVVGPAVLTMCMILLSQHGLSITLAAVLTNIILVGLLFTFADVFIRLFGKNSVNALSKVLSLLLAAIGVMMIRRGVLEMMGAKLLT